MRKRDGYSSQYRASIPFVGVLGAIFLLVIFVGFTTTNRGLRAEVNMLLLSQVSHPKRSTFSLQVWAHNTGISESPELVLIEKTSLTGVTPPMSVGARALGVMIGEPFSDTRNKREILRYVVQEGDTVTNLAEQFEVSENTILWANDLDAISQLTPGKELLILPTSGALHLARPGDTLSEIALWYKADLEEILYFNDIADSKDIYVGDLLIIPGGTKPSQVPVGRLAKLSGTPFIVPVPQSYRITQGLHPFNAVDFGNGTCGGPVYAAAGGTVQRVEYHHMAGNYVRLLHPNGVVTFYGHLSSQSVRPGEKVGAGHIIGYVGFSGQTIPAGPAGCHVHFEVRGAANPFAK